MPKVFILFFLISIFFLKVLTPAIADTQMYTFLGPDSYGKYSCIADKNGILTYDQCQAKLNAGTYTLNPGNPSSGVSAFCQKDPKGQYATYNDCQAALTTGQYSINPGNPSSGVSAFCQKDPKGQYATYNDCQATLHANKMYEIFIPSTTVGGNPSCVESAKGTYTWDGCQNVIHNTTPATIPSPASLPLNCVEGADKNGTITTDKDQWRSCTKIDTALGAFDITPQGFIKKIFAVLLSLSGGVAIILIMIAGYRLMGSQGNPEKVQAAREQLTSAIVGLLFIIFSVTILQIIGVDILHIPGLK